MHMAVLFCQGVWLGSRLQAAASCRKYSVGLLRFSAFVLVVRRFDLGVDNRRCNHRADG